MGNSYRGSIALITGALSVLTGCYYVYPTKLPPMHQGSLAVAGQPIEVRTREVKTFRGPCMDSDIEKGHCELKGGHLTEWTNIKHTQFVYGGHALTYAELRELADPEWPKAVEKVQGLKSSCRISVVPSTLALASAGAALATFLFSAKFSDQQQKYIYIGSAAGFVGFSAVSYPLGGHACRKSNKTTGAEYEWDLADWENYPGSAQISDTLLKLASDFNERVGAAPTPATDDPSDASPQNERPSTEHPSPPVDGPPKAAAPIASRVRDALIATGQYPTFVAAVDHAKSWDAFDAPAYTIFAPTEQAFAALAPEVRTAVMSTATMNVISQLSNHVVHEKLSRADIAKQKLLKTNGSRRKDVKKKGTKLLVGGGAIGDPIDTGDGLIYPIDKFLQ